VDAAILNRIARENEAIVERQFEKLNYFAERLDLQKKRPRPDFLVLNSFGPQMLCEVKTVFSGAYLSDRDIHVSTHDERLYDSGVFKNEIDLTKIDDCLSDAVRKRSALVADLPHLKKVPLVVAFFFDFFADFLPFYPRKMDDRFQDISGVLTIERDVARTNAFERLNAEEQEFRLKTGLESGLPPNTKDFVLVRNKNACRRVPRDFQLLCLTEPYNQSV
jgi:hypothetical protein